MLGPSHSHDFDNDFPQLDNPLFWAQIASQTDVLPYQDGSTPTLYLQENQMPLSYDSRLLLPSPRMPYAEATPELDDPTFWRQIASQVDVNSLLYPDQSVKTPRYPSYLGHTPEYLMLPGPSEAAITPYHPNTGGETGETSPPGQHTQATKQSMLIPILLIGLAVMIILMVFSTVTPRNTTFSDTTPEASGTWDVHCHQGTPGVTSGTYSIIGPATIDVDFINKVLDYYHSPMAGEGSLFANVSQYCGLDPAFVLAFYMHESSFGLSGEARSSLSPGNLRCIPGVKCQDGYAWFDSWQDGLMVQCRLLKNLYVDGWGLTTPEQIIPKYAPAADHNNEAGYEYALEHAVDTWRHHIVVVA